jgi:hypothetical protein
MLKNKKRAAPTTGERRPRYRVKIQAAITITMLTVNANPVNAPNMKILAGLTSRPAASTG